MICETCQRDEARFVATRKDERWVVCRRCRDQGVRLKAEARYRPLPNTERASA